MVAWFHAWVVWHQVEFRRFRKVRSKVHRRNRNRRRWLHYQLSLAWTAHDTLARAVRAVADAVDYNREVEFSRYNYLDSIY